MRRRPPPQTHTHTHTPPVVHNFSLASQGILCHKATGERLVLDDTLPNGGLRASLTDLVDTVSDYVQDNLMGAYSFRRLRVPRRDDTDGGGREGGRGDGRGNSGDAAAAAPPSPVAPILVTEDWASCSKLAVIINSSGKNLRPGIWSRSLAIGEGLEKGSMLPMVHLLKMLNYGVVILNPNCNFADVRGKKIAVPHCETPEDHCR